MSLSCELSKHHEWQQLTEKQMFCKGEFYFSIFKSANRCWEVLLLVLKKMNVIKLVVAPETY